MIRKLFAVFQGAASPVNGDGVYTGYLGQLYDISEVISKPQV